MKRCRLIGIILIIPPILLNIFIQTNRAFAADLHLTVAPSTIDMEVSAGSGFTEKVKVYNNSASRQTIIVYVEDYRLGQNNDYEYFDPGKLAESSAKWVTITPTDFTVAPGSFQEVTITVNAPADAFFGTHNSVVFFQTKPKEDAQGTVSQLIRVGVPILAAVGDPALPFTDVLLRRGDLTSVETNVKFKPFIEGLTLKDFSFSKLKLNFTNLFRPEVTADATFEVTGNTHLSVGTEADFRNDWFGAPYASTIQPVSVLPKTERTFTHTWEHAAMIGPSKVDCLFIYQVGVDKFEELEVERSFWIIPWPFIMVLTVLFAAVYALIAGVKRLIFKFSSR